MSDHQVFGRMSDEQEQQYTRRARLTYSGDEVGQSVQNWNSYSETKRDQIRAEGNAIYADIAAMMEAGLAPTHPTVQRVLDRWQQHIRYFYEPSLDILRGLGETYAQNPEFRANFEKLHIDLPEYLSEAVEQYVDDLETEAITEMLAEDEARTRRLGL